MQSTQNSPTSPSARRAPLERAKPQPLESPRTPLCGLVAQARRPAGAGYVGSSFNDVREREAIPSYGVGLRFMVLKAKRINLRLDYARSTDSDAIHVSVEELVDGPIFDQASTNLSQQLARRLTPEEDQVASNYLKFLIAQRAQR